MRGSVAVDLTGNTYGRLTVIERAGSSVSPTGRKSAAWRCCCECGTEKVVRGRNLRAGQIRSCGCLQREVLASGVTGRQGEENAKWRGDEVGYAGAHRRVKTLRGSASKHDCVDCSNGDVEILYKADGEKAA